MPNHLWSFGPSNPSYTATTTTPQGNNASGSSPSQDAIVPMPGLSPAGVVNVVKDFYWTYSQVGDASRAEVPRIILTERRLKANSLIAQLQYTLGQTKNNVQALASDLKGGSCIASLIAGLGGTVGGAVGNAACAGAQALTTPGTVSNALGNITDNNQTTKSPFLQPYKNLYITEPTGWIYTLPYFDNNQSTSNNSFSDTSAGTETLGFGEAATSFLGKAASLAGTAASPTQYTFIEKTKFYDYGSDSGESIDVEFPLINTGAATYDDVVRNWQFLYLLVYQNRPGKTGYNTVDQPVIYEVNVPGTKFFPYCYISNLVVEFVGSRRELAIDIPSVNSSVNSVGTSVSNNTGTQPINAIIPDAYRVKITLQSMTANTRNFMAHMVASQNVIQTGTSTSGNR
jgi:hypothetical protein